MKGTRHNRFFPLLLKDASTGRNKPHHTFPQELMLGQPKVSSTQAYPAPDHERQQAGLPYPPSQPRIARSKAKAVQDQRPTLDN